MKHLLVPAAVTAVLGLTGAGLVLYAWQLPPFSSRQPQTENAYVRGKITTISARKAGILSEVLVSDFQQVRKGEVLMRLDSAHAAQDLARAEADLASARADLNAAEQELQSARTVSSGDRARLDAARLAHSTAEADSRRQGSLRASGIVSEATMDKVDLELRKAEASLATIQADLAARDAHVSALQAGVRSAASKVASEEAKVANARLDLAEHEILAPADGTLGQISGRVGMYVAQGTALASHVGNERWIIANFTETSLPRLGLGQPVDITVDAMPGTRLSGRIAGFSPATSSEFSLIAGTNATGNFTKVVQRLPLRIEIDPSQDKADALLPGMSVIVTAQQPQP